MNHGRAQRQCQQNHATGKSAPRRRLNRRVNAKVAAIITAVRKDHSVEAKPLMDARDHDVVEPFPGIPGLPAHRGRERIGPRDRMGAEHQIAIADVPSDAGIAQQARS